MDWRAPGTADVVCSAVGLIALTAPQRVCLRGEVIKAQAGQSARNDGNVVPL
jgi:hypothetical protein